MKDPRTVWFIDTSVLCELLEVPGMNDEHDALRATYAAREGAGDLFVIPVTTVIETGNHICNARGGDRRAAAQRFVSVIEAAANDDDPSFTVLGSVWNAKFLRSLCAGASTGQSFLDLAGGGQMGGGDVAILVELDAYRSRSRLTAKVWTKERVLGGYGG